MRDKVRIAAVQMDPEIMANRKNLDRMCSKIKITASNNSQLIVFPECALTGYVYTSREEALPFMETIPGPSTEEISACCRDLDVHVIFGLLEKDGDSCFNAVALVGPQGLVGKYRKVHLPYLGIDRFVDPGDQPFRVYQTPIGNIGMHICYDCNFPESSRSMALLGADILVLPTNWPAGRGKTAAHVVVVRAYENKVNFVAVDRAGSERGTNFLGHSKIIDTGGDTLVEACSDEEIIYAEVSLLEARQKHVVIKPGEFELDFINDRRPELYGEITKSKNSIV